ncbi:GNAT family N-acetyltransferase [Psychrobacillus sp. FJAT-51614]|uniref:GNAT family N-acetyltransferase n=1 Tax=Psychrobacillus mangrovi TaxID=3117745 RepID=A0ABU8F440_9BACI
MLAYNDEADKLVGLATAIDRIATLDFEWSAVVSPSFRRQGIGEQLVEELKRNFEQRGAETDLALVPETAEIGQLLLTKHGYSHDFSERTMVGNAEIIPVSNDIKIIPYTEEESAVIKVLVSAFGDTEEEARELIRFNTVTPNRQLMIALMDNEVVGTVSLVDDSDKLWVTGLAVHEKARGRGIATALLNWSKNEAHLLGKSSVYLDVETDNENALSIYSKAGFQTIQHTHFYRKE